MHIMSALEYSFLVKELAPLITGRHFARIRKLSEKTYRMKVGTTEIICELGIRLHATRYLEEAEESGKFAEKISKELDNAKLLSLEQINNDRILSFNFDSGKLIFEMFGEGNAILVRDGRTVAAHHYESWSDREIKAGSPYSPPRTAPSEKLELSDRYVIVSLTRLSLGKEYALEALAKAKIDEKKPGNQLTKEEIARLESALSEIRSSAKPHVFYENGKPADFSLVLLSQYSKMERKEFATFSEAADEYYAHFEKPDPRIEKLEKRLEKQKEHLSELIEQEKSEREKGDFIYAHYAEVENILDAVRKGKQEGKLDKKEKSVEVEI